MKKYMGLVKIVHEGMYGTSFEYKTKFSDDLEYLNLWFELYPNREHVVLNNSAELENIYKTLEDLTAVTEDEKKNEENAKKLYKKFMED